MFSYSVQQSKYCLFQTIYFWIFCREYESMSWCYCSNFTCPKWKKMRFYLFDEMILVSCLQNTRIRIHSSIFPSYHVVTSEKATTKKHTQLIHAHIPTESHQPYIDWIKCISASFFSYIVLPNSCWFGLMRCSIHTHICIHVIRMTTTVFASHWFGMLWKTSFKVKKNIVHIIDDITSIACDCSRCVFIRVLCVQSRTHTRSLSDCVLLSECWCSCCCW